jgi:anti-sigma factor RsiW
MFQTTPPMTCHELVRLITDYFEGSLSARDRRRFERHLRGCDGCTTYVEQMRETARLAGALHERDLSPYARDQLLAAFRDWKDRRASPGSRA